jgi:hypothetical protein
MPRKPAAKRAAFGIDLIEGVKLVLAHQRGKIELEQVRPKPVDVKAIRTRVPDCHYKRADRGAAGTRWRVTGRRIVGRSPRCAMRHSAWGCEQLS